MSKPKKSDKLTKEETHRIKLESELKDLKAVHYDQLRSREIADQNLQAINGRINQLEQELAGNPPPPTETDPPEETPETKPAEK